MNRVLRERKGNGILVMSIYEKFKGVPAMSGKKRTRYHKTIFLYFLLMAVVPLLILGVYAYHSAKSTVRDNVRQANETALVQVENAVDNILDGVRQNFYRIAVSTQTSRIVDQGIDDIDYQELRDYIDEIGQNQAYIGYVKGYTLVNFKRGWVLSNKGMFPIDEVVNREEIEAFKTRLEKIFWINHADMTGEDIVRERVNTNYISFVAMVPVYTQEPYACFVVNLDQARMEELFSESLSNSSLTIFDNEDQLVFTENPVVAEYYQERSEALDTGEEEGLRLGGTLYDIVKHKSDSSYWTYIAAYDSSSVNRQLTPILFTMGGIILAILALVGFLGTFGSNRVYRPVKELVDSFSGMVEGTDAEEEDEFGLIHQGINRLVDHNEELQGMILRQRKQLAELFGMRLIRGQLREQEVQDTMARLQIEEQPFYCVVSAVFCRKDDSSEPSMEQDVLNLDLMESMPEEISGILLLPPFLYTRAIVMVLGSATAEKMEEKILALRNCLSVYVATSYGGYVDMGVSRLFEGLSGFRKGYQESLEALKINEYYGHQEESGGLSLEDSSITYYADLIQKEGASQYSLALDAEIREAVDGCDKERAFAAVDGFLKELSEGGAVMYEQHFYLYRFLMTILSVPVNAGVPVHDMFPGENLFRQFNQLYDYNDIGKFYKNRVILPVISRLEQFRKNRSEAVLDKIISLVNQCGGDLTLAECAERLGYHPSYIWRVMKNTRDITFTDYLAEQKVEMAKEMLVSTDMPVAEIAEKLNYSNAQNFIRLFKKHMGVTPGQYRKEQGGER